VAENYFEPAIAGHHVLLEELLDRRRIVARDRRWRRGNFIHNLLVG